MDGSLFGYIITAIGAIFGSKLVEVAYQRWIKKVDDDDGIKAVNQAKLIDADQIAMQLLHSDVTALKAEVEGYRKELDKEKDGRRDLQADNKILLDRETQLTDRLDRQGTRLAEVESTLEDNKRLLDEARQTINARDKVVITLQGELNQTRLEVHALAAQLKLLTEATERRK